MSVLVPTVVQPTRHGERAADIYSRLLTERIVMVGQPIDDDVANVVMAQLLFLEAEDPERDISLHLNTPGGSVTAGLAIYDTMRFIRPDVRTVCAGQAASMGAVLLAGGAPGKRLALPHSRVLVHQPSQRLQGQASDLEIHAAEIDRLRMACWDILAAHTGREASAIAADADRDLILPAEEARRYGLVDEVITRRGAPATASEVAA